MNEQDKHYTEQGYELPEGVTWEDVELHRQKWGIDM
jgi:hypothetical protein